MISFFICLACLIIGYMTYGRVAERVFGPDDRETPATTHADGVDYVALPTWRIFMIQFLNIAGTGPIFGAIMGMWFGPAAFYWIVFGNIFVGTIHDYFSGMMSMRHHGWNVPSLVGEYMGEVTKKVLLAFLLVFLIMCGVVLVYTPALIIEELVPVFDTETANVVLWVVVIFVYYIIAATLPIDKVIARLYPLFAFALLFMAVALFVVLVVKWPSLPELWDVCNMEGWRNGVQIGGKDALGITAYIRENPLFPCLFITLSCGACSGFHATQSPMMVRCLKSERLGRKVFYGAMMIEGVVALVWAAISAYFFYYGGWKEVCDEATVQAFIAQVGGEGGKTLIQRFTAPDVVNLTCTGFLGLFGGIIAVLGVVAAPITSGDTAFRSARLIVAEWLHFDQKSIVKRLSISVPMFLIAIGMLVWQLGHPNSFNRIWQYFGLSNQMFAAFGLWLITVYLVRRGSAYMISLVPALFMTSVCVTAWFISPQILGLGQGLIPWVAFGSVVISLGLFCLWKSKQSNRPRINK